jgi:hypothetical protein
VFKDGGKEEKKKNPISSPVKCYFIRMESNATIDQSEYILSRKTVYEARSVFMHAHGLSSVTSFMARYVNNSKHLFSRAISEHFLKSLCVLSLFRNQVCSYLVQDHKARS